MNGANAAVAVGERLIVQREGKSVRPFIRDGNDRNDRYPLSPGPC